MSLQYKKVKNYIEPNAIDDKCVLGPRLISRGIENLNLITEVALGDIKRCAHTTLADELGSCKRKP